MLLGLNHFERAALADTPPSSVTMTAVTPGQSYPEVPAYGEGWFDLGGYCKVVDVGNLSSLGPTAVGVPVFIPGPAGQWENYRTLASSHYNGQLALTTCCRPQNNIGNLCTEDGATPVSVTRQYGRLGETDTVTATCAGAHGSYQDSMSVLCSGDNGPDGQASWAESGGDTPSCTTAPVTTYGACSTAATGGWGQELVTVTDCLGHSTSQGYTGPACYTAPPCPACSADEADNGECCGPGNEFPICAKSSGMVASFTVLSADPSVTFTGGSTPQATFPAGPGPESGSCAVPPPSTYQVVTFCTTTKGGTYTETLTYKAVPNKNDQCVQKYSDVDQNCTGQFDAGCSGNVGYIDDSCGNTVRTYNCASGPPTVHCSCSPSYDTTDETDLGNGCAVQYYDCGADSNAQTWAAACAGLSGCVTNQQVNGQPNQDPRAAVYVDTSPGSCPLAGQSPGNTYPVYSETCNL